MNKPRTVIAMIAIAFVIAIGAVAGRNANAAGPSAVNLGAAATFSVLAGSEVTNTLATTTDRDVGVSPGTSISGFPPGIIGGTRHTTDAVAAQAQSDLTAAYVVAANAPVTASYTALGGQTLIGGVYDSGGATMDLTGTLTLNGLNDPSSVWIFKASSDLVTASSSRVTFINGASPCNVFWQITSSATLGSDSTFVGTIMALTSITVNNGVTVYGRALARNGLVSLINDRFLTLGCAGGPTVTAPPPIPPTRPPFTVAPSAAPTVAPTVPPAATPIATPASSVTPTTAPTAAPIAAAPTAGPVAVGGTQRLPSTSTSDPSDRLTILGVALAGVGIILLRRRRPIRHL